MGVYKLSAPGTLVSGRLNYKSMLAGNAAFNPTSFESIATVTVGAGGSSSITFSSIPSTYTHLQIRYTAKWNFTNFPDFGNTILKFNNDSSASYAYHRLSGNGASAAATGGSNFNEGYMQVFMPSNTSSDTNVFGAGVIDILDYANTNKNKTLRGIGGFDRNGAGMISLASVLWSNTNAINRIDMYGDSGLPWLQHSSFALYGIKGGN